MRIIVAIIALASLLGAVACGGSTFSDFRPTPVDPTPTPTPTPTPLQDPILLVPTDGSVPDTRAYTVVNTRTGITIDYRLEHFAKTELPPSMNFAGLVGIDYRIDVSVHPRANPDGLSYYKEMYVTFYTSEDCSTQISGSSYLATRWVTNSWPSATPVSFIFGSVWRPDSVSVFAAPDRDRIKCFIPWVTPGKTLPTGLDQPSPAGVPSGFRGVPIRVQ